MSIPVDERARTLHRPAPRRGPGVRGFVRRVSREVPPAASVARRCGVAKPLMRLRFVALAAALAGVFAGSIAVPVVLAAPAAAQTAGCTVTVTLRTGSRGASVRCLEQRLVAL